MPAARDVAAGLDIVVPTNDETKQVFVESSRAGSLSDGVRCGLGIRLTVDWKFLIAEWASRLVLLLGIAFLVLLKDPFVRKVWPTEWYLYAMPYTIDEKFPVVLTVMFTAITTCAVVAITTVALKHICRWRRNLLAEEIIFFLLGFSLSVIFAMFTTEFIKRMYGRPRPDFLSRCFGSNDPADWVKLGFHTLAQIPEVPDCGKYNPKMTMSIMRDARMSFPSGHSSMAWAAFLFLALWVYGKLCLFQNTGALRLIIPFGLLLCPTAIAISRTSDYRHHVTDVIGGAFLGMFVAVISYLFYWPLSMKPLIADVYCIFESSVAGQYARLRTVPTAKLRVQDPHILTLDDYHCRRSLFYDGRPYVGSDPRETGTHPQNLQNLRRLNNTLYYSPLAGGGGSSPHLLGGEAGRGAGGQGQQQKPPTKNDDVSYPMSEEQRTISAFKNNTLGGISTKTYF